jgi:ectoine hydroxylase-related dioxygenase (phytanoyl-CoA dioxygenase family)
MEPVGVDARVEFLSDEWIDEARRFLEAAAPDVTFTLCESFTDPPPGIDGAWHVRIDRGRVEAGAGEIGGADLHVEGDYQAVLAMAQTVYAAGPDAVARARRELVHRHGADAIRVKGDVPAELQGVLGALHDHMAARTIENPHLDHRVERLGLQRQVRELAEQGYTVIERAVSEAMADELREHVEREVRAHHPFTTNGLLLRHRLFEEVALHPLACTAAQSVVGQGMILGAMSGTYKEAGPGLIDIHADYPLVRAPFPEQGLIAVACWALEDWTEDAGPTWVIPGSHRERRNPTRAESRDGATPILMPKGSIALWANGVWHWQGDRSAPGARVAIHVTYNRIYVRPLDDLSGVGPEHYARNPPAFSTLMGGDDPFGKSSFTGHDGPRFAYAGRMISR